MKIKESDLKRLIQESMQELALEALEEEWDKKKDTEETDEPFKEQAEFGEEDQMEEGWGLSGTGATGGPRATGRMGAAPGATGGGLGKLGPQFQQMLAKAKAGDMMAKKNVIAIAKANPGNKEMQAAVAELEAPEKRAAQVASNPFTAMDTKKFTQTGAVMQQEAKLRKVIAGLVKEVLAESAQKKNKKPVSKKK